MGHFYEGIFNEALGRLALDLLMYRHRMTHRQVEKGLMSGSLYLPPEVGAFILKNVMHREYERQPFFVYLYRGLRLFFLSNVRLSRLRREQLTPATQHVIQYMEEELEVHYDSTGQ